MDFFLLEDDNADWQDPVAVLLYTCVSFQLLFISLCGQMQVFIYSIVDVLFRFEFFDFGSSTGSTCYRSNPEGHADYFLSMIYQALRQLCQRYQQGLPVLFDHNFLVDQTR